MIKIILKKLEQLLFFVYSIYLKQEKYTMSQTSETFVEKNYGKHTVSV